MRHVVGAGTDVTSLLLFDPGALPEDFDARARGDPYELLEQLTAAGQAAWVHTGADGAYLLHPHLEEPVPASLQPHLRDPLTTPLFAVPTGRIYFTGAKYGFREDDRFLRKHPHMGGAFAVRPGVYRLTLWRTEYPGGLPEQLLRQQVAPRAYRLHRGVGWLATAAALGLVGLSVAALVTSPAFRLRCLLPVGVLLVLLPVIVSRLRPYRQARERLRAVEREFPSIVAELEFRGAGGSGPPAAGGPGCRLLGVQRFGAQPRRPSGAMRAAEER